MRENPDYLVLFDGECNLCNKSVQLIIKYDSQVKFSFASLQSKVAKSIFEEAKARQKNLATKDFTEYDSVVLYKQKELYFFSQAGLEIARQMDGAWPLLDLMYLLPAFLRDIVYKFIARNRFRWFGKSSSCMLPDLGLTKRFLG